MNTLQHILNQISTNPAQITSCDKGAQLTIDMPGVSKEALKVSVKSGILSIRGTRKCGHEYAHDYRLTSQLDPNSIKAKLLDGVLTIDVDAKPEAASTAITVE